MKKTITFLAVFLIAFTINSYAQTAKSMYKTGLAFSKNQNYSDALIALSKAIELNPEMVKAYAARAHVYEMIDSLDLACLDYNRATALKPNEEEYFYSRAHLCLVQEKYEEAIISANKALSLKKKYIEAANVRTLSLYYLERYGEAELSGQYAFKLDRNYDTYYNLGLIYLAQKKYAEAEEYFRNANREDQSQVGALISLGHTCFIQKRYNEASNIAFSALNIDQQSKDALWLRALSFEKTRRFQDAINDLSQIIVYHPDAKYINDMYLERAKVYFAFKQNMNAVNDYSYVIEHDSLNAEAYFGRAEAYEAIRQLDLATKDYEYLTSLGLSDPKYKAMLAAAGARLYELKREDDKPVIVIENPVIRVNNELEVVKGEPTVYLSGKINDASEIKKFKVNGSDVSIVKKIKGYKFTLELPVENLSQVTFEAEDVYGNNSKDVYTIVRTEVDAPEISLITPYANDDGQIYLDSEEPILYIEGVIMDESKIASILIDSVNASYIATSLNPSFSANVNIANKNKIWIEVEDIYGNKTHQEYLINRDNARLAKDNPMGKTWVIFIENSNYKSFASLDGPTKDVTMMKAALAKYQIHNIIHKRDMTKTQMERFFFIELRDLVRKNHVNSIVVWYAGHGKFINNTGYWIPVDANRDDEFAYFNINSLKAAMQSYSSVITHTLVVTDACESGPTFYQAMRSGLKIRDCGDWKATKFKSSQVFSSAGYELASDNSQFTKTFANTLSYNPNSCIPIESIVKKVTSAVARNKQQKPQFGKIDGLADENGTFFFIKR